MEIKENEKNRDKYLDFARELKSYGTWRLRWYFCKKNSKLLFFAGITLAVGVRIYIFRPMRMTDAILPRSPPRGNIKGRTNHFSPFFHFLLC